MQAGSGPASEDSATARSGTHERLCGCATQEGRGSRGCARSVEGKRGWDGARGLSGSREHERAALERAGERCHVAWTSGVEERAQR